MNTFLDNNALVPLPNALAANLLLTPLTWLELAVGTADADNRPRSAGWDTAFDSVESLSGWFELRIAIGPPGLSTGSYRLGLFVDGRRRTVFGRSDPVTGVDKTDRGWLGVYASFDQWLYREPESPDQGLGAFARFAWADPRVNAFDWFWSLGAQYTGLLPRRDADVLGIGSYQTIGSQRYQNTVDPDFDRETGVEVYYRVALLPWLHITPGFQYIIDPGASKPASDAVVVALRIRTTF